MKISEKTNKLTLIEKTVRKGSRNSWYGNFQCECGNVKEIRISAVKEGGTKSCGCHRKKTAQQNGKKTITHGMTNEPLYIFWGEWKHRNKNIWCKEWENFESFRDWAIANNWEKGLGIARKDLNKHFYPENCFFKNSKIIAQNNRSKTNLEKYGYETALKNEKVKQKIRQSNLNKYGYECASQSDTVKQNTIENNREKYGVDYPQQLEENKEKNRQFTIKNKQAIVYNGKTITQLSNEVGVARDTIKKRIEKYGYKKAICMDNNQSLIEKDIKNIFAKHSINFKEQFKIENRFADFLLTDSNVIVEADGIYWHSDAINKNNSYHKHKLNLYNKHGYQALFFREDEINKKIDIIESIILNKLKMSKRIFARKTTVKEVSKFDQKKFFNKNHLMGNNQGKCIGLYYGNELYTGLQFLIRNNSLNISRFCHKLNYSVVGGFSKLIHHLKHNYNLNSISTFIDQRYGNGKYLSELGFKKITNRLSFVWVKDDKVVHRMKFPKNSGYDHGYDKLWDCGQVKWVLEL